MAEREGDKRSQDHKNLLTVYYPLYFGFIGVLCLGHVPSEQ